MTEHLIGHWPLAGDTADRSANCLPTEAVGISLGHPGPRGVPGTAGAFDGATSYLRIPDHPALRLGREDFTLSAWIHTDEHEDVVGSLVGKYDAVRRQGLHLYVLTNDGVTSTALTNSRQLTCGLDDGTEPILTDCGRPGKAVLVAALSVVNSELYAGTLEIGEREQGRLWRYPGDGEWLDLGNPLGTNVVHSITGFEGDVYCGVGRYNCSGSVLGPTLNTTPGGRVFRVTRDGEWTDCGQPGGEDAAAEGPWEERYETGRADDVIALMVHRGQLYAVSNHRRNVFRYEGGQAWRNLGLDERLMTFCVYRGQLYALTNGGPIYRLEGDDSWTYCGTPAGVTQTYGAVTHYGRLYVGTWPQGQVFHYDGGEAWTDVGSLGYEREVMAMTLYNSKPYLGSLPMANLWRMDNESFSFVGNLDNSPVMLRRVWSMAVHNGGLYAGTLPSGRVWRIQTGAVVTDDSRLSGGWHHVAVVRVVDSLWLYVDGEQVAISPALAGYDLDNAEPLTIGFGPYDYFRGLMSDVRLYSVALPDDAVAALASDTYTGANA